MTTRIPRVGETVIYFNRHEFPRAALVTGTHNSLFGEQHVAPVDTSMHVHLTMLSPLSGAHAKSNVPHASVLTDDAFTALGTRNTWAWPDEVEDLL